MLRIEEFKSAIRKGIARSNLYRVDLPFIPGGGDATTAERNYLCKAVNLPGRQITTNERQYGVKAEKMPYGFLHDDVSLTFNVTNDYALKLYFEAWQARNINPVTYELSYKSNYAKNVNIHQLDHNENVIYTCKLLEAYPTTMNAIQLSDEQNGLVEINVQLSFKDWRPE